MSNLLTQHDLVISTLAGLEEILVEDVQKIGGADVQKLNRAVACRGDLGFIYKANLALRTALRVYQVVHRFEFKTNKDFYEGIQGLDWAQFFVPDEVITIHSSINDSIFSNSMFVSQLSKDAIADQFRERFNKRPYIHNERAKIFIQIHVFRSLCTISFDSSGQSLHIRGYRKNQFKAPINEVLAAGIIKLSGWHPSQRFYDPMCGSGTFSIEAALMAKNIPPGFLRPNFAFMNWLNFDESLFDQIVENLASKISEDVVHIFTSDNNHFALQAAHENVTAAELDDVLKPQKMDFENLEPKTENGFIFLNPPYGERLESENIDKLYGMIGATLKHRWAGHQAWMITSSPEGLNAVGLRPSRRIALFNGALECRLVNFQLYSGSKKTKKQPGQNEEVKNEEVKSEDVKNEESENEEENQSGF